MPMTQLITFLAQIQEEKDVTRTRTALRRAGAQLERMAISYSQQLAEVRVGSQDVPRLIKALDALRVRHNLGPEGRWCGG